MHALTPAEVWIGNLADLSSGKAESADVILTRQDVCAIQADAMRYAADLCSDGVEVVRILEAANKVEEGRYE